MGTKLRLHNCTCGQPAEFIEFVDKHGKTMMWVGACTNVDCMGWMTQRSDEYQTSKAKAARKWNQRMREERC